MSYVKNVIIWHKWAFYYFYYAFHISSKYSYAGIKRSVSMSIFDIWNSELSFLLYFKQKKAKLNSYNFPFYISLIEFLILQLAVPDYIQQNKSYSETQDTLLNGKKFHMANISDFCRFQVNHNIQPEKSKSQNVKSGWEAKSQGFCNFWPLDCRKINWKQRFWTGSMPNHMTWHLACLSSP